MSPAGQRRGLFDGLRVLEFSWFGAGPIGAKWLADLGADVVRVEGVTRPDALRLAPPRRPEAEAADLDASGYYNNFNSSKRSIVLEMSRPAARPAARRLVEWCDVLIENFRPSVMARWGLDYETVGPGQPALIYVAMPAVGREGPRADYAGFGTGIKLISGLATLSGVDGQAPVTPPGAFPDYVINCGHGVVSILAALLHRQATGEGQFIEVAQMESTAAVTGVAILEATVNGVAPPRLGNRHRAHCPHGVFPCAGGDAWIAIAVTTHDEWTALARAIGHDDWLHDQRFATLPSRRRQAGALEAGIAAWTSLRPAAEAEATLVAAGVPAAKSQTNRDLLDHDVHLRERGYYWTLDHPSVGPSRYDGAPFRLSETPARGYRPAPRLGEHSFEVYREAGFSAEEISELVAEGVISG